MVLNLCKNEVQFTGMKERLGADGLNELSLLDFQRLKKINWTFGGTGETLPRCDFYLG